MSHDRILAFIDELGDPVQAVSADGTLLFANRAWRSLLGYGDAEVATIPPFATVHPDDREHFSEVVRQALSGSVLTVETRLLEAGGRIVTLEGTSSRHEDPGTDAGVVTLFRDVTHQKELMALLAQSEQRFRVLTLNAPVGIFELNARGDCSYANECWSAITGLSPVASLGRGWLVAIHPEDRKRVIAEWFGAIGNAREFGLDFRCRNLKSGETQWLACRAVALEDATGAATGYLGIALDLTERKKAEVALATSEQRYRDLIESSLGLIFTHDMSGRLVTVNPATARALGWPDTTVKGQTIADITAPRVRHEVPAYLERITSKKSDEGLMAVVTPTGEERIFAYRNIVRCDADGNEFVLGHAQDVTTLKRAEERVRALSLTDELTGLANRRGFMLLADQALRSVHSSRAPDPLLLVSADMDGLKQINDTLGHQAGDEAILSCAQILKSTFRDADIIARLGGDEFVVLAVSPESEEPLLSRLGANLETYNQTSGKPYQLALSFGSRIILPGDPSPLEELLAEADQKMYERKRLRKRSRG